MAVAEQTAIGRAVREALAARRDGAYRDFQSGLLPTVDKASILGVRTPALRALAKEFARRADAADFLDALPHAFFDENQLHAFMIALEKDFGVCMRRVCLFLPYVDNWATCDQLSPRCFAQNRPALLAKIREWLASGRTYTVRFGLGMLMRHFLDADFDPACLALAASVRSQEYYVNMMIAWYFATALAKQYDAALPYIEQARLAPWTHNRAIQKAAESRRVAPAHQAYLKTLKRTIQSEP